MELLAGEQWVTMRSSGAEKKISVQSTRNRFSRRHLVSSVVTTSDTAAPSVEGMSSAGHASLLLPPPCPWPHPLPHHALPPFHQLSITAVQVVISWCGQCVGFNVPLNTLYVISGTTFTGQMTKPTVSKH